MKRRTEVIIEIEREIIISRSGNNRSWCSVCGKQVQMLSTSESALMLKSEESVIYGLADSGILHFAATTEGMLLICPDSLVALRNNEHTQPSPNLLITEGEVSAD